MTRRRFRTVRRKGAHVVEFAITAPVVILCLVAMIQLSRASMVQNIVDQSAYEAARVGIVPGATDMEIMQAARRFLRAGGLAGGTVSVRRLATAGRAQVQVNIKVPRKRNAWGVVGRTKNHFITATCTLDHENGSLLLAERP